MTKHDLKELAAMGAELGAAKAECERLRELLRDVEFRGLLTGWEPGLIGHITAALSQQDEPTDTYTAVDMATAAAQGFRDGQAAMEQAAAQDERECETGGTVSELLAAIMHFGSEKWAEGRGAADPELANVRAAWDSVYSLVQDLATRPAQTEQQLVAVPEDFQPLEQRPIAYPHEAMDKLAADRYRVGAAGAGTLHGFAVRAGDGEQELYRGSKSDCEHVARKLAGAFLDGGLTAFERYAAPIAQAEQQHPDDAAVDRFAAAMKAKLAAARAKGRGGWDDPNVCSVEFLAQLLVEHLAKGNAGTFEDVANFAMMLHQRGAEPKVLADAAPIAQTAPQGKFRMGDLVKKSTGSEWEGRVVGWYSTEQTKEGYAVESSAHRNSVQIYPVTALEAVE